MTTGELYASANGIRICYETFGDPAAPPLVLIMGLAAQMIVWDDEFCRRLAAEGFWVIRFDNRDIGHSTRFDDARTPRFPEMLLRSVTKVRAGVPYTLRDMAADTLGLMDALGITAAHVVGASMGGAIAQELAIDAPQRLRSMTSIMGPTGNPKTSRPQPKAMAVLGKRVALDREGYVRDYVQTWAVLAGDQLPFDPQRLARQGGASYDRGINPAGVARQMTAIIASGNRLARLRGVRVPTLIIHGTSDPLVPPSAGREAAATIPGARLVLIEGMGHYFPPELWPRIIGEIANHAHLADGDRLPQRV
jgi:pimeloyl-ACP methyl ester carboxylesterase